MSASTIEVPIDWRDLTTISVPAAGELLGLSRNSAYAAAHAGQIPTISLGAKLAVPTAPLRRLLGELPPLEVDRLHSQVFGYKTRRG